MTKEHETNNDTVEKPAQTDITATEPQVKGKNAKTGCLTFVILFFIFAGIITIFDDEEADKVSSAVDKEMPWTTAQIIQRYNEVALSGRAASSHIA